MKIFVQLLQLSFLSALMTGCRKKVDIQPTSIGSAFVTFINVSSQSNPVRDIPTINNRIFKIDEDESSIFKYYYMKINAGNNNIKLLNKATSQIIMDTIASLLKDNYYTVLVYDSSTTIKTAIIKDSLPKPSSKRVYRFINLVDIPKTNFTFRYEDICGVRTISLGYTQSNIHNPIYFSGCLSYDYILELDGVYQDNAGSIFRTTLLENDPVDAQQLSMNTIIYYQDYINHQQFQIYKNMNQP